MSRPTDTLPLREVFSADGPGTLLARLPRMGRVMMVARDRCATHERIGPVERADCARGAVWLAGECHAAEISLVPIRRVVLDRRTVMGGNTLPRLEFLDAAGTTLFSAVGLDGLAPFEDGLAGLARGPEPLPGDDRPPDAKRADFAEDDPAMPPFARLLDSGAEVTIAQCLPGITQSWTGRIAALRPAMGFLNIMTPDFHLHLPSGALGGWREASGMRAALDADGRVTGLTLRSEVFA